MGERHRFLLTYIDGSINEDTYAWFESEDEMKGFVADQRETAPYFQIYEAQEIVKIREIEV